MKLPKGMVSDGSKVKVKKIDGLKINIVVSCEFKLRVKLACWCFRLGAWIMGADEIEIRGTNN